MKYEYRIVVDGESGSMHNGDEEKALLGFYQKIRELDCGYKLMELYVKQDGGKEFVRATAYSDGRKI